MTEPKNPASPHPHPTTAAEGTEILSDKEAVNAEKKAEQSPPDALRQDQRKVGR